MISLPTGPLLFDTGIYIRFCPGQNYLWLGEDAGPIHATSPTVHSFVSASDHYPLSVLCLSCEEVVGQDRLVQEKA